MNLYVCHHGRQFNILKLEAHLDAASGDFEIWRGRIYFTVDHICY